MTQRAADGNEAGRVVVIIGASSGIGRALAVRCAHLGDALVLVARRGHLLRQLADEIAAGQDDASGRTATLTCDVREHRAGIGIVDATLSRFGKIDIIVYTAGWNVPKRSIYETTPDSWQSIIETNLTGAFSITSAAAPVMRAQGGGLLVYVSSSGAKRPDQSGAAYQASKAGVAALAHATMEECRVDNIRTTVIFPGLTDTPFVNHRATPPAEETRRRALLAEDVAEACTFVMGLPARVHVPELLIYPSRT